MTWSKIWFSDTTYRSLFLPEGLSRLRRTLATAKRHWARADRLGVSSRVRFVIQVHLSQSAIFLELFIDDVSCHGLSY